MEDPYSPTEQIKGEGRSLDSSKIFWDACNISWDTDIYVFF